MSYTSMGAAAPTTDATRAALEIVRDPYLRETACHVLRLSRLEETGRAGPACKRTRPTRSTKGVGLVDVVGPLRLWVKHRQRPYIAPLVGLGFLGAVYYAGMLHGRKRR